MPVSATSSAGYACAARATPFALAGTERKYERARPFVIRHLALDIEVELDEKAVRGTATLSFERVSPSARELVLDAVGFDVRGVQLDLGRGFTRAAHDYDGDRLTVSIPQKASSGRLRVVYRARPLRGLYFLGPDEVVTARPVQVWSQCQDQDARHWLPCHDEPHAKMTTDFRVSVPKGFSVLSNGELVRKDTPRGPKKWSFRFRMKDPVPSYLVTLVVGRFDLVEDRPAERPGQPSVPVSYLVPIGRADDGRHTFAETPRMMELFGKLTGIAFPYSRYSQVIVSDFIFIGMENSTATTLCEHILLDRRARLDITSNDVIAHELAHHWFGNFVTCRDWSQAWLNEGFATFFQHVEREDRLGRDEYEYGLAGDQDAYLGEAGGRYARPLVCREYEKPLDLFDRHLYQKGSLVLHMLRRELGDELFWRGVHQYLTRHAHGIVETVDLMRALERVSGRSFEQFFDQWVYRPGHPKLKVTISWERGQLTASVEQSQDSENFPAFAFPLELEIAEKSGKLHRQQKWVTGRSDALVVALSRRPAWVGFDPDFRVIGDVSLEVPNDLLLNQLEKGSTARLRWMAARTLKRRGDSKTVESLGRALANESEAWMVRAEVALALGELRAEQSYRFLKAQARTAHPKVRRAVVEALGQFKTLDASRLLAKIARKDESYLVEAEAARALGRTRQPGALEALLSVLDDASWADVKRAGALEGLAALRQEQALLPVLERTRYGLPSPTRCGAVAALAKLGEGARVRDHLEGLLDDSDPFLRLAVADAVQTLDDPKAAGALRNRLERELDSRVTRRIREVLRDIGKGDAAERRRLKDEVEELRREVSELKLRVGKEHDRSGGRQRRHSC